MTARSLTVEGRKPFPVRVESAKIIVDALAQVPVVVYAEEKSIPSVEGAGAVS
jgi:hypothetical protein